MLLEFSRTSTRKPLIDKPKHDLFGAAVLYGLNDNTETLSEKTLKQIKKTSVTVPEQEIIPSWPLKAVTCNNLSLYYLGRVRKGAL
jgi:hypothetical protein